MIKLIASDMDGTLLNKHGEINDEFFSVFDKLKEKEIIFCAASGRQYYNLLKKFEKVKDDVMFIAENGTFVVYRGEELVVNALDNEIAKELIRIGRTIDNSYVIVCGKNSAYIENTDERFVKEARKYYERCLIVDNLEEVKDDILKVTMCDFAGAEKNSNNYFKEYVDKLQVTVSGEIWLDITANNVNKGLAIEMVQNKLNISEKETMVFGDYLNDLEMMQKAHYSFAMENAHEDLKKVSNFTAKSNEENGVVEKIKEVVLVD